MRKLQKENQQMKKLTWALSLGLTLAGSLAAPTARAESFAAEARAQVATAGEHPWWAPSAPSTQAAECGWISCYDGCKQRYVSLRGGACNRRWDSWSQCYKAYTYCY
jgi:hypothetical protein